MTTISSLAVRTGDSRLPFRDIPQGHIPKANLPNPTELKVSSEQFLSSEHAYNSFRPNLRPKQSGKKTFHWNRDNNIGLAWH
jgi:hypothetical protein